MVDAFDEAANLVRNVTGQRTVFVVDSLQSEMQLAIKLVRSRGDEFVHQIMKPVRLYAESRVPKVLTECIDYCRKVLGAGEFRSFKWPHRAMVWLCTIDSGSSETEKFQFDPVRSSSSKSIRAGPNCEMYIVRCSD